MVLKRLLKDLGETLIRPVRALQRVADTRSTWQGLVLHLVITLVAVFFAARGLEPESLVSFFNRWSLPFSLALAQSFVDSFPVLSLIMQLIFGPLLFLLWLAVVNLCAELFNGEGEGNRLGAVFGFASLPYILVPLGVFLAKIFPAPMLLLSALAAFTWTQILKIIGLKEAHGLTVVHSIMVYLLPLLTIVLALVLFALMSIAFLLPFVVEFLDSLTTGLG
jgi:hypothetical protein